MKSFLLLTVFVFSIGISFPQAEKKIDSKVASATVFKSRALVTREAQTDLLKGINKIIFSNLPIDLLDNSVRISTAGNEGVKILDVKVERRFTPDTQQKKAKILEEKIDSLTQVVQIAVDQVANYISQKEFIESLKAQSSKYISEKMLLSMSSTKDWTEMLKYVEKNLDDIYKGIREQNNIKTKIEKEINAIKMEMSQSSGANSKNYKEIIVEVEAGKNSNVKLYPSYLVQNASWYSLYDARVTSEAKEMELYYYGMIQQSTGEDWKDISITLSTAEPLSVKSLPQLDTWFLDTKPIPYRNSNVDDIQSLSFDMISPELQITYDQNWGLPKGTGSIVGYVTDKSTGEVLRGVNVILNGTLLGAETDANGKFSFANVPVRKYDITTRYIGYQARTFKVDVFEKQVANLLLPLNEITISSNEITIQSERPRIQKDMTSSQSMLSLQAGIVKGAYTEVFAKEMSTVFSIPSKSTIPSDNSPHKVTISIEDLPVEFEYTSIPKIIPSVYLKGRAVNKNNYPLLEGELNIFVDNDFINRTYLNTIVQSDTFDMALGIDDRIQVKKNLINKFQESKGLLSGSKQITHNYEIQVTNNRQTDETILIYDQVPVAMNEDIKVELIEPQKEIKDLGNELKLEWNIKLKPGEKKIIPIKYQIEFPKNLSVYGLE